MARVTGQLDEISQAIGRVDAYVHEFRHGTKNLETLIKAADLASEKRSAVLKLELSNQIEKGLDSLRSDMTKGMDALRKDLAGIDNRVVDLERLRERQAAQLSTWAWIVEKLPFAALFGALAAVIAWANGKLPL